MSKTDDDRDSKAAMFQRLKEKGFDGGQSLCSTVKEFYNICDREGKGYVVRSDMKRLHEELDPLTDEQLEDIFDVLDVEDNKYVTVEEFIEGFDDQAGKVQGQVHNADVFGTADSQTYGAGKESPKGKSKGTTKCKESVKEEEKRDQEIEKVPSIGQTKAAEDKGQLADTNPDNDRQKQVDEEDMTKPAHFSSRRHTAEGKDIFVETMNVTLTPRHKSDNAIVQRPDDTLPQLGEKMPVERENPFIQETPDDQNRYNIAILGDSGVGKTCFFLRFCENIFPDKISSTIGVDFLTKKLKVDGRWVTLFLWDTAGQERYHSLAKQYYRRADGILFMFDIAFPASLNGVKTWLQEVKEVIDVEKCVFAVIGNKTDLCKTRSFLVPIEDSSKLATENNALYFEVSSRTGDGVYRAMQELCRHLIKNQSLTDTSKEKSKKISFGSKEKKKSRCC